MRRFLGDLGMIGGLVVVAIVAAFVLAFVLVVAGGLLLLPFR